MGTIFQVIHFMIRHFMSNTGNRGSISIQTFNDQTFQYWGSISTHESDDQTLGSDFEKSHFFIGGNSRVSGRNSRVSGSFCRSAFWGKQHMLNISFKSRVFSSSTLMDGEDVVKTHTYDSMDETELEAELARLEDCMVFC